MSKARKSLGRDPWTPVISVLFAGFLWFLAASLWQGGWHLFGSVWLSYLKLSLVLIGAVSLFSALKKGPVDFLATLGVYFALAWIAFSGSFSSWKQFGLDLGCAIIAVVLTVPIMGWLTKRRNPNARTWREVSPAPLDAVVWVLLAWVMVSVLSTWLAQPLPTEPQRFAKLGPQSSIVPTKAKHWEDLRIGIALSGGGYRAALLHAGVLEALEDLGIRVGNLSTVSGGSIIGAYYAVGGDPKDFVEAVRSRRLDLKRHLMMIHNALRLPFPMRVPGVGVELLPFYRFDRLDAQRELLQDALFEDAELQGGLRDGEPSVGQPALMIAATDLTYGFQVGLLPDGMLKLGRGIAGQDVYRGSVFEAEQVWGLAQRVAVSGAFPLAFPSRVYRVRVSPMEATGRGVRELLLVDGGIRDNLGLDLLRAADRSAENGGGGAEPSDEFMPPEWNLDALLVSNGGAVFGVLENPGGPLAALPRAFDITMIDVEQAPLSRSACQQLLQIPPTFSPSMALLSPDTQFNLKNDSDKRAVLEREWSLQIDPARYPSVVLERIVARVQEADRAKAEELLQNFQKEWGSHQKRDGSWSRSLRLALKNSNCGAVVPDGVSDSNGLLPGSCEAAALRQIIQNSTMRDLDIFRAASTVDDRLPRETIDSLERLGQLLVYLQWPRLERTLDQAVRCGSDHSNPTIPPESHPTLPARS